MVVISMGTNFISITTESKFTHLISFNYDVIVALRLGVSSHFERKTPAESPDEAVVRLVWGRMS